MNLKGDLTCSAHCKQRFICQADQSRDSFLRGGRNIWGSWRVTSVAFPNVNDASYVRRINHERYFVVQSSTGVILCSTGIILCSTE